MHALWAVTMRAESASFYFILFNCKYIGSRLLWTAANDCNISLRTDRACIPSVSEQVLVICALLSIECTRDLNVPISAEWRTKCAPFGFLDPVVSKSVGVKVLILHAYCSTSLKTTADYHEFMHHKYD